MAEKDKKPEQHPQSPVPADLRDRLACAALTGLVLKFGGETSDEMFRICGQRAYRYADAVLAARDVPYVPGPTEAEKDDAAWFDIANREPVAPRRHEEWLAYSPEGTRYDGFSCRAEADEFVEGKGGPKGWTVKKSTATVVADPGPGHRHSFADAVGVAGR